MRDIASKQRGYSSHVTSRLLASIRTSTYKHSHPYIYTHRHKKSLGRLWGAVELWKEGGPELEEAAAMRAHLGSIRLDFGSFLLLMVASWLPWRNFPSPRPSLCDGIAFPPAGKQHSQLTGTWASGAVNPNQCCLLKSSFSGILSQWQNKWEPLRLQDLWWTKVFW